MNKHTTTLIAFVIPSFLSLPLIMAQSFQAYAESSRETAMLRMLKVIDGAILDFSSDRTNNSAEKATDLQGTVVEATHKFTELAHNAYLDIEGSKIDLLWAQLNSKLIYASKMKKTFASRSIFRRAETSTTVSLINYTTALKMVHLETLKT